METIFFYYKFTTLGCIIQDFNILDNIEFFKCKNIKVSVLIPILIKNINF